ncbi:3,4-dihydroxy-2-butanone 4-phosphate synthase [Rhodotorula toruloides]|uniref:3,4-dihydroxy-2-butanone 4-phosphate synthase n=1 Tax=Rhodotorula toruloides TaxID=5286 RepID=A0A511K7W6_RHOTO|nr:3,4-dihydroxy-2-butanone 4-phosphate synthase [Rhodotorula toruloides]
MASVVAGSAAALAGAPAHVAARLPSSNEPSPSSSASAPEQVTTIDTTPSGRTVELDSVEDALEAFRKGDFLVVVDDMDRENEGDLIIAADRITQQQMAWLIRHSSGYVCICLPERRLAELDIPMMVEDNKEKHRTAYTITCDYKHGTTTGISAHDRALTARKLADPSSKAEDFTRPGHLVPLRAVDGGVLVRRGHTEASVDLCRLAGLPEAGVICELVKPDDPNGDMARRDDCFTFARQWGLKMISIEQLEQYRREKGL